jgi:hypothetical protein
MCRSRLTFFNGRPPLALLIAVSSFIQGHLWVALFATNGSKKQVVVQRSGRVFVERKHILAPYQTQKKAANNQGLNSVFS